MHRKNSEKKEKFSVLDWVLEFIECILDLILEVFD